MSWPKAAASIGVSLSVALSFWAVVLWSNGNLGAEPMTEITIHEGIIYYSPEVNRFFQIRGLHDDYYLCGDFTRSYMDSTTVTRQQQLSHEFINESKQVVGIDQMAEAEYRTVDWFVKEK